MEKQDTKKLAHKRRNKKLLLLFIVFGITIIGCVYTTYAWFVGLGSVKVNNFTINMVTDPSLEISLDGYTWDENITVTENAIKGHSQGGSAYNYNSNSWVGEHGLVPVSSSGDNTGGKLDIFTKTSMDATGGGYQLVADKIDNSSEEKDYYVAFDIFVKNKTGDVYNTEYNLLDDENIYLTTDSSVIGTANGETSYGIQNSARVAFVQIGRIDIDDLETGVTPVIECDESSDGDSYTPLCNQTGNHYKTMIWEPNETSHDTKVVNYYNLVCHGKTSSNTYDTSVCVDISDGYVPAYTIKKRIRSSNNVDVYDGLNGYTSDISEQTDNAKYLQNTKTFTDTMKATGGEYTLLKLHPHSVTKIRVYVYLEGQDVDNYDLVTKDLNIQVNFGFTKERTFTGEIVDDSYFSRDTGLDISYLIPDGCTYRRSDGQATYTSGMTIPDDYTPQPGDTFEDEYYTYIYKQEYLNESLINMASNGWSVRVKNVNNSDYGEIINSILEKPITSLAYTYCYCRNLEKVPDTIPSTVQSLEHTFDYAGIYTTNFDLNLGNWDTSSVIEMQFMFYDAGLYATTFNIGNLGNWDTSSVTNMHGMFTHAGLRATTFNIGDLANWDTSSVTNMDNMFENVNKNLTLNLTGWNVNDVTNHSSFRGSANIIEPNWIS